MLNDAPGSPVPRPNPTPTQSREGDGWPGTTTAPTALALLLPLPLPLPPLPPTGEVRPGRFASGFRVCMGACKGRRPATQAQGHTATLHEHEDQPSRPPPHGFGKETHTRNKPTQPYICNITCVREARVVESARANEPGDGAGDDTVPDAEPG